MSDQRGTPDAYADLRDRVEMLEELVAVLASGNPIGTEHHHAWIERLREMVGRK